MIRFRIERGQELVRVDNDVVAADTTDLMAHFDLGELFTGAITTFWRSEAMQQPISVVLNSSKECLVPYEVLAKVDNKYGVFDHYVFVSIADSGMTTSSTCTIKVQLSQYSNDPENPGEPTPTIIEQLTELVGSANDYTDEKVGEVSEEVSRLSESIVEISRLFESEHSASSQLFDKSNYIYFDGVYVNSALKCVSMSGYATIALEINGSVNDKYAFKVFDDSVTLSHLDLFTSNSVPSADNTLLKRYNGANPTEKRGFGTLTEDAKYLVICFNANPDIRAKVANGLTWISGAAYPTEYIPYSTEKFFTVAESVEKRTQEIAKTVSDNKVEIDKELSDSAENMNLLYDLFEDGDSSEGQLFNKNNYIFYDGVYINSSLNAISYSGYSVIALEINGNIDEKYSFKIFDDSISFSVLNLYASDSLPNVGSTMKKSYSGVSPVNRRGTCSLTENAKYLVVCFDGNASKREKVAEKITWIIGGNYPTEYIEYAEARKLSVTESISKHAKTDSKWKGKTIWWCGTSIPEGKDTAMGSTGSGKTYPQMVAEKLGAICINVALGSSMARANTRTGDYTGGHHDNILRAFTSTLEEKQELIDNWSSIYNKLMSGAPSSLTQAQKDVCLDSSFETRLMPYLDGTYPMPDLFVIDHGHNDHKYMLSDGSTDIGLKPTTDNISKGELATDTFMTANSNAKISQYFGEVSAIPSGSLPSFIASVNRNCYIGAINFLCTLILSKNPRAKIVFIGNLDNWTKTGLVDAQEYLSSDWGFPMCEVWKYLGLGRHFIPNTSKYWSASGTLDLQQRDVYLKDAYHPHSDTTGETMENYATVIAEYLENCVTGDVK